MAADAAVIIAKHANERTDLYMMILLPGLLVKEKSRFKADKNPIRDERLCCH
jgi:hypothetical protein